MLIHAFILIVCIGSLSTISLAGISDQYNEIGVDNVIPPIKAVGGSWRCSSYCRLPMNIASMTCRLNATRLPHHPLTPENADWPLFNPYCWCLSPYIMNYTPRCLWCLGIFKLLPAAVDLMHDAFDLCVSAPINFKPCPSDCGALQYYVDTTITPCIKQAADAGVKDPVKSCWCRTTTQTLITNCWFCMLGWNLTASAAIKARLDVCGGVFRPDPLATSSVVAIARPMNASLTIADLTHANETSSIVTPLAPLSGKIQNGMVAERHPPPPTYISASAAIIGPHGGPAEGYFDAQNTAIAIVKTSGGRRPSLIKWWPYSIAFIIVLLCPVEFSDVILGCPF